MAQYEITLNIKGGNIVSIQKKLAGLLGVDEGTVHARRVPDLDTRSERFAHAMELVSTANGIVQDLKGELEEWRDNMPEGLQNGGKHDELEEAISNLEEVESQLDEAENASVDFPSMMG